MFVSDDSATAASDMKIGVVLVLLHDIVFVVDTGANAFVAEPARRMSAEDNNRRMIFSNFI